MRFWAPLFLTLPLAAADPNTLFRDTILPLLEKDCQGCHGASQTLSKLDLRSRESLLKGGTRGPAILPNDALNSPLFHAVAGQKNLLMPPGKPLPAATVNAFKDWINAGAPWPTTATSTKKWDYKPEDLWAFQPVKKSAPPSANTANPIDAFLDARLRAASLPPAPKADKRTLIRRLTIDLTGLPPSPDQIDAFLKDNSPQAYPNLIDRLLSSPRYGERAARHWLDVVRYADTSGYSNDFERPNAWRYRDYVIRAFNSDKPYNQFIREQIAGDELDPANPEFRIATGFLRAGPWEHTGMSVEAVTRQMFLDDVTSSIGSTFLALTLGCARCHDHKFDPIPTKDYYSLQAIFATTEFARPKVDFLPSENTRDLATGKARISAVVQRTKANMERYDIKKKNIPPEKFEEYKLYQKHMQLYRESQDRFEPKAFAVSSGPLDGFTDGGQNLKYPPAAQYKAPPIHILPGGNVQSPAEKVDPGLLSVIPNSPAIPNSISGRRLALANWIASPSNPLTARVIVNRIWQSHFGRGLAPDSNNFGKMGAKPSHPELLDFLAASFVENGWSIKSLHRLILTSNAYQRASSPQSPAFKTADPDNKLLSFFPPRRVEAEVLRDSILAVSGELSLETGGPGVFPQINQDVARQPRHAMGSLQPAYFPSPEKRLRNRRTIYTFQQRSLIDPMVEVFNGPSLDLSCERRESSTVPTQAFALLNSEFAHDMALAMAHRVAQSAPAPRTQIQRLFYLAYGRAPAPAELQSALTHLQRQTRHHQTTPPPPIPEKKPIVQTITSELTGQQSSFIQDDDPSPFESNLAPRDVPPSTRALADLALVLLNSNEFVYVY